MSDYRAVVYREEVMTGPELAEEPDRVLWAEFDRVLRESGRAAEAEDGAMFEARIELGGEACERIPEPVTSFLS